MRYTKIKTFITVFGSVAVVQPDDNEINDFMSTVEVKRVMRNTLKNLLITTIQYRESILD